MSTTTTLDRCEGLNAISSALNHKAKRRILRIIARRNNPIVKDICIALKEERSYVTKYLGALEEDNIVRSSKVGRKAYYSLNDSMFSAYEQAVNSFNSAI